jgi:hypothetical protein
MRRVGHALAILRPAAALAGLATLLLVLNFPAHADTTESLTASIGDGGIRLLNDAPHLCTTSVVVCGQQLNPLTVEVGGGFTVKIDSHFRSSFECSIVNGQPNWVQLTNEGSCEPVPIITLPAAYDEDEAWNVG